jgi:hypothetical protein
VLARPSPFDLQPFRTIVWSSECLGMNPTPGTQPTTSRKAGDSLTLTRVRLNHFLHPQATHRQPGINLSNHISPPPVFQIV